MTLHSWAAWVAVVSGVVLSTVSAAQAQTVTFSDINDAVPGRFFDATTSGPDRHDPNKLIIRLNTGLDFKARKFARFTASTAAFFHSVATDTISFRIEAPDGYYVSRITYTQRGTGSVARTGRAAGSAQWVVDDNAIDLGTFGTNPTLTNTVDLTDQQRTLVPVSITTSLFTYAPPRVGSATISVTSAEMLVELLPLSP